MEKVFKTPYNIKGVRNTNPIKNTYVLIIKE